MKQVLAVIGCVVGFIALLWIIQGNDFFMYKLFAPKYEQTRREVFESTKSYQQGMVQDLTRIKEEYVSATSEGREMLKQVYLQRLSDFDRSNLPPQLKIFTAQLEGENLR